MRCFGVSVSIIEPDFFKTPMTDSARLCKEFSDSYDKLPRNIQEDYGTEFLQTSTQTTSLVNFSLSIDLQAPHQTWKQLCFFAVTSRMEDTLDKVMNNDITPVLDAYTHALLGRFPQARYSIGKGIRTWLFLQSLPEWLGDRVMDKMIARIKPAACR